MNWLKRFCLEVFIFIAREPVIINDREVSLAQKCLIGLFYSLAQQ